jgi:hypothetical protein
MSSVGNAVGLSMALEGAATETVHQPRSFTPSSSKNMDEGRFPPGTLLAQSNVL